MLGDNPGLAGQVPEDGRVGSTQGNHNRVVIRCLHILKILPEAVGVSRRILFEHIQGKDYIGRGKGLAIGPFDIRAQLERQGFRAIRKSITLGEPGLDLAVHAVKEQQRLVNHALGAIVGARGIRTKAIGKIAFGAGDNGQHIACGFRGS